MEGDANLGRFRNDFTKVELSARGQFSVVYRAQHKLDQQYYAVKVQLAGAGDRLSAAREVAALGAVANSGGGCENIVRYFAAWQEDGRMHIQMELCECTLRSRMIACDQHFGDDGLMAVLSQVSNGLSRLHGLGFAHLDIKPENILCNAEVYKIADLGLATPLSHSREQVPHGDCRYLPKEVLQGTCSDLTKADVFSLGLVCYEMANNPRELPPNGEQWQRLRNKCLDVTDLPFLSGDLARLVCRMANPDPACRPSCPELVALRRDSQDKELEALRKEVEEARAANARSLELVARYQKELMAAQGAQMAAQSFHMTVACLGG